MVFDNCILRAAHKRISHPGRISGTAAVMRDIGNS